MEEATRRKANFRRSDEALFRCAAVVLSYLTPTELASVSLTCKPLHKLAKSTTYRRTSDASRGFENLRIPFLNPIAADSPPYSYFLYTPTQTLSLTSDFRQAWGSDDDTRLCRPGDHLDPFIFRVEGSTGCDCVSCSGDCCPCLECGPSCECGYGCGNRASQGGITARLKIVKDERKGWGLYAAESIPCGQYVCEYAGELLSTKEARERQQIYDKQSTSRSLMPSLLVVKEHLPSRNTCIRINIDATRIGNVARFINHSCDGGNLDTTIVRSSGALLPRVCFFASRDIHENEELTFSYGDTRLNPNGQLCFCGSSSCAGVLPSEHT